MKSTSNIGLTSVSIVPPTGPHKSVTVTKENPAPRAVLIAVVLSLLHKYVIGAFPFVTTTSALPSSEFIHVALDKLDTKIVVNGSILM